MTRSAFAHLFVMLTLATTSVHAQYASVDDVRAEQKSREEAKLQAVREALVGAQYWVEPIPNAKVKVEFYEAASLSSAKFVLTEPATFKVKGSRKGTYGIGEFILIEFADGKEAYLSENLFFKDNPRKETLLRGSYKPGDSLYDGWEYILPEPPEKIRLAAQKSRNKAKAAAAAWKAKGGVRIGMTASEVRSSNWGKPESVNRSTGSYGVHEQWVYGGNNYLYFENGVLKSIQN